MPTKPPAKSRTAAKRRKPVAKKPVSRKPARQLSPDTTPAEPHARTAYVYLPARTTAGMRVTEDTALTYSAVWACIRCISETLAMMPFGVYLRRANGGRDPQPDNPVDWMLDVQANPETTAQVFRETLTAHCLTHGNGFAEIERDAARRPVWQWQIAPDRVCVDRDSRGRLIYDVSNPREPNTVLPAEDVVHLKGLGFDGLVGYSVIAYAARSIGTALAADQAAATLYQNDSTPGGVLKHPGRLSEPARKNIEESWQRRHGGPANRRMVAVLEEGMDWAQTTLPPEDAQLLQSRQFSPVDICRWFRVPPHKIAELTRATFSNIEEQGRDFVTDSLMPWAVRWEKECNIKLFGRTNRGTLYTRHTFNSLLRGNVQARSQFYQAMADRGVFSVNDILSLEEMNPIGPDGDKRMVPLNMQLLEQLGEEPEPPETPQNPDGTPPDGGGDAQDGDASVQDEADLAPLRNGKLREAMAPVFEDACRRVLHAERERAREGLKVPAKLESWFDKVKAKQAGMIRNQLRPAVVSFMLARGKAPADAEPVVGEFADLHLEEYKAFLAAAVGGTPTDWEAGAGDMASRLIDRLEAMQ